jgi:hypothetical protein
MCIPTPAMGDGWQLRRIAGRSRDDYLRICAAALGAPAQQRAESHKLTHADSSARRLRQARTLAGAASLPLMMIASCWLTFHIPRRVLVS